MITEFIELHSWNISAIILGSANTVIIHLLKGIFYILNKIRKLLKLFLRYTYLRLVR